MGLTSKGISLVSAAAGLAVFSQAPEFAQQYRQRLGGAVEELQVVVEDFDRDAGNSSLSRDEALQSMQRSNEQFSRDRGQSMRRTVDRYVGLSEQQVLMEQAHPVTRPLFVLRQPDPKVLEGAWEIFEPAVPLTVPGMVYGGVGALILTVLARSGIGTARWRKRRRNDRKLGIGGASSSSNVP